MTTKELSCILKRRELDKMKSAEDPLLFPLMFIDYQVMIRGTDFWTELNKAELHCCSILPFSRMKYYKSNDSLAWLCKRTTLLGRTNWTELSWSIPARIQAVGFGIILQSVAGCQYGRKHPNVWVLGGATKQTTAHCVQTAGNSPHSYSSRISRFSFVINASKNAF